MLLFQKQNKDFTELFIDIINRFSMMYIYVLAFWSYDSSRQNDHTTENIDYSFSS